MATKILVFVEGRDGKLKKGSLECLSEAARLKAGLGGGDVTAVFAGGPGLKDLAPTLGAYGADRVLAAIDPALERYEGDAYARVVVAATKKESPAVLLFSATVDGKDLSPRVAAALGAGLATDVTGIAVDGGKLLITRPIYAGKAYAQVAIKTAQQVVSVRPNTFAVSEAKGKTAPVEALPLPFAAGSLAAKVLDVKAASGGKTDLTEAERIVAGGRGMKGPEHFKMLEDLCAEIGAVIGASRAVVDAGWRAHADQVGQTGKTVSPNLYFAVGISGAIQHLAGMQTSKCIVAINKDADAPIFKVADYGIVGDAFEVVPRLIAEIRKLKAK